MDEKKEIEDKGEKVNSEDTGTREVEHHVVQRVEIGNIPQISGNDSYQEAPDYADQTTLKNSIQKAGYYSKQIAEDYAVQISGARSLQRAGNHARQMTSKKSMQFAGDFAIQYGESSVRQKAGRTAVQIGGVEVEQFAGDYSVQCAENNSFQSAGTGSVSIVYGSRVRCKHQGLVLQVLIFHDRAKNETVILSKLIDDGKDHLLEAVKRFDKWALKDTIIE